MKKLTIEEMETIQGLINMCEDSVHKAFYDENDGFHDSFQELIDLTSDWGLPEHDDLKDGVVFEFCFYNDCGAYDKEEYERLEAYDYENNTNTAEEWLNKIKDEAERKTYHYYSEWLDEIKSKWDELTEEVGSIEIDLDNYSFSCPDEEAKKRIEKFFIERYDGEFKLDCNERLNFAQSLIDGIGH